MHKLSNEDYHAEREHVSKSGLDRLNKSPFNFINYEPEAVEASHFRIGRATHHFLLEGDTFADAYTIGPDVRKNTKVWKQFVLDNEDKEIISRAEFEMLADMEQSIQSHPVASELLGHNGEFEESFFAELDGVRVKCRPDWYSDEFYSEKLGRKTRIIVDLKTARSAEERAFTRSIFYDEYRYHVQAAFYLDVMAAAGLQADMFYFLVVEKTAPYAVAVYAMSQDAIHAGRIAYEENLRTLKACRESDVWPSYNNDEAVTVYAPQWLLKETISDTTLWSI